jgi:integrase
MSRVVRDANMKSRAARAELKIQAKPHWRELSKGVHVGYRKTSTTGAVWVGRRYRGNQAYESWTVGAADDFSDPDNATVLSWSQAQDKVRERAAELANAPSARPGAAKGPLTVRQATANYLAMLEQAGKDTSDSRYRIDALIDPLLGDTEVAQLTNEELRTWHAKLASTPRRLRTKEGAEQRYLPASSEPEAVRKPRSNANRTLAVLRAALNHAWREGLATSRDAWDRVKPFAGVDSARVRYLSVAEVGRLINACDRDFRLMAHAAVESGARYSELARLRVDDFNSDAGTLAVRRSKSGKARHIVLTSEGAEFFAGLTAGRAGNEVMLRKDDGGAWNRGHQTRPMIEACKRAGIVGCGFHGLRHTWASLSVMAGMPLMVVARNLGHSDTRMVEKHYGHLAPSFISDAIRASAPRFNLPKSNVRSIG